MNEGRGAARMWSGSVPRLPMQGAPIRRRCLSMLAVVVLLAGLAGAPASLRAQDAPNAPGFTFDHVSFVVPDYDAMVGFWRQFGGSQQVLPGRAHFSVFHFGAEPVVVTVTENAANSGGTVGSVVDHFGFQAPDVTAVVKRLKADGIRVDANPNGRQAFVYGPDGIKIELLQDATLKVPLRPQHVHFFSPQPEQMRQWYTRIFGGMPGTRGPFIVTNLPTMQLAFSKSAGPVAPTRGRALDHIGFAVTDLQQAQRRLEAEGIRFEPRPPADRDTAPVRIAMFVDPWGTRVELIQRGAQPPSAQKE